MYENAFSINDSKSAYITYADFESLIEKVTSCQPNPQSSSTTHKQKHKACGYSYVVVCSKPPVVFRGQNAVDHVINYLMKEEAYIREKLSDDDSLNMNDATEESFQGATHCIIFGICFTEKSKKVRDHDHLGFKGDVNSQTYGNVWGATCQACYLQLKQLSFSSVIMHNLKGYDSHLLLSEATTLQNKTITCIPTNMEKCLRFSIRNLRFHRFVSVDG